MPNTDPIANLKAGPPILGVRATAELLGISAAYLYQQIKQDKAPVKTINVGSRIMVLTASVVNLLSGSNETEPDQPKPAAACCPACGVPLSIERLA